MSVPRLTVSVGATGGSPIYMTAPLPTTGKTAGAETLFCIRINAKIEDPENWVYDTVCPFSCESSVYSFVPAVIFAESAAGKESLTYQSEVLVLLLKTLVSCEAAFVVAVSCCPFVKDSELESAVNKYALSSSKRPSIITEVPQWNKVGAYVGDGPLTTSYLPGKFPERMYASSKMLLCRNS